MRRGDVLLALSVPLLLAAGLLPWQRDRMCTAAGCGDVEADAWGGSVAWAVPLLAGLALAGLWLFLRSGRGRVPTAVAALTLGVAVLAAAVVTVSLDAIVFGRTGLVTVELPVVAEFPVLSVRPAEGLGLGLAGLLLQAAAGWTLLRRRGAFVSVPGRAGPGRAAPGRAGPGSAAPGPAAPGPAAPGPAAPGRAGPGPAGPGRRVSSPSPPGPAAAVSRRGRR